MGKWSEYVIKYICKKFKCIVCDVHQQAMSGDNEVNVQQNPSLLLPAISKLADNLMVARDYMTVFALFNPNKYKAYSSNYEGYDMKLLNNKFRQLCLLKHRDGMDNIVSPLYFNGKINYFKELPLPKTPELQQVYDSLKPK